MLSDSSAAVARPRQVSQSVVLCLFWAFRSLLAREQCTLKADHGAASAARRWVAGIVESEWGAGDAADDVVSVASELVTNACLHGAGPVTVSVRVMRRQLCLRVQDRGRWREPSGAEGLAEGGRGLAIVEELAESLTIQRGWHGRGTCVIAQCSAGPVQATAGRGQL